MRNIHKYTAALLSTVMILSLLLTGRVAQNYADPAATTFRLAAPPALVSASAKTASDSGGNVLSSAGRLTQQRHGLSHHKSVSAMPHPAVNKK